VKLLHRCFVSLNPGTSHRLNVMYAYIQNFLKINGQKDNVGINCRERNVFLPDDAGLLRA
jgi:hypothetical protein